MKNKALKSLCLGILAIFIVANSDVRELEDIAYTSRGQLCSVSPVEKNNSLCLKTEKEYHSPSWQPQGNQLVVMVGYHDGPKELVLIESNGALIGSIKDSSEFFRPVWSPDGRYIYALGFELKNSIGRWDARGRNFTTIPVKGLGKHYQFFQMISFSPSGKLATILIDKFEKMLIVEVSETNFNVKKILPNDFSYVAQSVWLDDTRLLFVGKKNGKRGELWEININDESIRKIGISGLWLRDFLAVSPDKRSVVVCALQNNQKISWNLWLYSLESGKLRRITYGTEDVNASWRN